MINCEFSDQRKIKDLKNTEIRIYCQNDMIKTILCPYYGNKDKCKEYKIENK